MKKINELFYGLLILCSINLVSCNKDDKNDEKTNEIVGEYIGTISMAHCQSWNASDFMDCMSNPSKENTSVTIRVVEISDTQVNIQCISSITTFDITCDYEVIKQTDDNVSYYNYYKLSPQTNSYTGKFLPFKPSLSISSKNMSFSYNLMATKWNTNHSGREYWNVDIKAFKQQ